MQHDVKKGTFIDNLLDDIFTYILVRGDNPAIIETHPFVWQTLKKEAEKSPDCRNTLYRIEKNEFFGIKIELNPNLYGWRLKGTYGSDPDENPYS
jgi:hypothetical protein